MSSSLETCVQNVFAEVLLPVARQYGLQMLNVIDERSIDPQRLVLRVKDTGENKSVRNKQGRFSRALQADITLFGNVNDRAADWMDGAGAAIQEAIQSLRTTAPSPAVLAPFSFLVITEIEAAPVSFDKSQWVKEFTVSIIALAK